MDIYYDLAHPDGLASTVWARASMDGGASWQIGLRNLSGHAGQNVMPGINRHIIWDAGADMPGKSGTMRVRVYADDGDVLANMVYVGPSQGGPGAGAFWIGKYTVTNQEYCQFLNDDQPDSNEHWDERMEITRTGSAGDYTYQVASSRENYPIRFVSYYDALAYCDWRSEVTGLNWRLPNGEEWAKAAGWDPELQKLWTYGFQRDEIDETWANYGGHYGGLTEVGYFNGINPGTNDAQSYYGCYDMSGNVREWTTEPDGSRRVVRGGHWGYSASHCTVTLRFNLTPPIGAAASGFASSRT